MQTERHPLEPFLPEGARILMLGSFPPPHARWSMEWFYPNFQNDMWRIWGHIEASDKNLFVVPGEKRFDRKRVMEFCRRRGIALYDTATEVVRLRGNASDNFLQVVRPTDVKALLDRIPQCRHIVTTGQKASETLQMLMNTEMPKIGCSVDVMFAGRALKFWRMPSSSRAYPRPVEWKADFYRRLIE